MRTFPLVLGVFVAGCSSEEPVVTGVSPGWGSSLTEVTLTGESFREEPTVWVDGVMAEVIAAEEDRIVIEPALAVDEPADVSITVQSKHGMSNPIGFRLVPSGTAGPSGLRLPAFPAEAVVLGSEVYLAAMGYLDPEAGLYVRDDAGVVTRVWEASAVETVVLRSTPGVVSLYDAPTAVATDGTDVWFGTTFGGVYRYAPATGRTDQVIAASYFSGMSAMDGLAFDDLGNLYTLTRSGDVLRLEPDGDLFTLGWGLSLGDIASDGASLYLTDTDTETITVVEYPGSAAPVWLASWVVPPPTTEIDPLPTPQGLAGIAVLDDTVVVSDRDGYLFGHRTHAVGAVDGGTLALWGDARGYGYAADGLSADGSGNLILAQPESGMVRRLPAAAPAFAENLLVTQRPAYGIARSGSTWYLATSGRGTSPFDTPPETILDGAVVELGVGGSSRLVASQVFPIGVVANGDGTLTVGDCFAQTLTRVDIDSKSSTTLAGASDGVRCVGQMWEHGSGAVFYANAVLEEGGAGFVGRLATDGGNDPDFVTGLPYGTIGLTGQGDTLFVAGIGTMESPIFRADATVSGPAEVLVSSSATGMVTAIGASPRDALYAVRFPYGEIVEIDVATGQVYPFGSARTDDVIGLLMNEPSYILAMGFWDDGTMVLPDHGQGKTVAVAP